MIYSQLLFPSPAPDYSPVFPSVADSLDGRDRTCDPTPQPHGRRLRGLLLLDMGRIICAVLSSHVKDQSLLHRQLKQVPTHDLISIGRPVGLTP